MVPPRGDAVTKPRTLLRRATDADVPQLEAWSRDFEHGAHGEPFIATTFRELNANPVRGELLVIERDGAPAGYVILARFWSNEFRGDALILDELYVAPSHRGGTGEAVLAAIDERAREQGARMIALEVLESNERVHALYRRAGYASDRTLYQKRLAR